jgi:hypothetical protein
MLSYAYGLVFDSQFPLPELPRASEVQAEREARVTIRVERTPETLKDGKHAGVLVQVNRSEALIDVPNIARYRISQGDMIVIDPYPAADNLSIRLFLLSSVLGTLFHQRRALPLRASSVATPNGAVVIAGQSGIGKSTLAAVLDARGWGLLSDDITLVRLNDAGQPLIVPGYPQIGLWKDVVEELGLPATNRLRPSLEKYALPAAHFHAEPLPLKAIYTLAAVNRDELTLTPIEGLMALPHLLHYIYGEHLGRAIGAMAAHWETAGAIAGAARVAQVTRPVQSGRLDQLVALIEEDMAR